MRIWHERAVEGSQPLSLRDESLANPVPADRIAGRFRRVISNVGEGRSEMKESS